MKFGIDVSEFQTVDYAKAKSAGGVLFAIPRAGYGRELNQKDELWEQHYAGFKAAGVPMGAYQYSYAKDLAGARAEAKAMIEWCKGKSFALPVYIDMEESSVHGLGHIVCTAIATEWCKAMTDAGYRAGVYANSYWFSSVLDKSVIRNAGYSIWCADWGTKIPDADIWQFGGETNEMRSNRVTGVSGTCDQNYLVKEAILTASEPAAVKKEEQKTTAKTTGGNTVMVELNVIKKGSTGAQVRTLQRLLISQGYSCGGYGADGDFGDGTLTSVKSFQANSGLEVDGICGQNTWNKLLKG